MEDDDEDCISYYAYLDEESHKYYYFSNQTQETVWEYPTDGDVLDPKTGDLFPNPEHAKEEEESADKESTKDETKKTDFSKSMTPDSHTSKRFLQPLAFTRQRCSTFIVNMDNGSNQFQLDVPDVVIKYDPNYHRANAKGLVIPSAKTTKHQPSSESPQNDQKFDYIEKVRNHSFDQPAKRKALQSVSGENSTTYMESKIRESASGGIALQDFARGHFKKAHRGITRQQVPIDTLTSFETECISEPLLNCLPDSLHKSAVKMFQHILEYTGANGKSRNENAAIVLVRILEKEPKLIDELFFQLIKQTNGCPSMEILGYTWELFCIIATIFPCSKDVEVWIQAHIASSISNEDTKIRLITTFTYIRFTSRCSTNEVKQHVTDSYIKEIPIHYRTTNITFGVSLYELMWSQRRTMPQVPLPYFLVQIIRALIEAGAFSREGLFHITGNIKMVNELERAINLGDVVLDTADVDDLASLLKRFFRELVGRVVPQCEISSMIQSIKDGTVVDFAEDLPPVNMMTLGYLVGFLQDMVKHQDKTHMSLKKLAALWAPNIMQEDLKNPCNVLVAEKFLERLVDTWDVSAIYPFKGQLL